MQDWMSPSELCMEPARILGVRLVPLTLGHIVLLDEIGVDIIAPAGMETLLLLAVILSQSASEARRDLRRWWLKPAMRFLAWRNRKRDVRRDAETLRVWVEFHLSGPRRKVLVNDRRGHACAAPLHCNLLACALGTLHLSPAEAYAMPVRTLRQLVSAHFEMHGELRLKGEKDYAFDEMCKLADAEAAASARN